MEHLYLIHFQLFHKISNTLKKNPEKPGNLHFIFKGQAFN